MRKRTARAAAGLVALSMVAAACGSDDDGDDADDGGDAEAEADAGDEAGDDAGDDAGDEGEAMDEEEGEDAAPAGDGPTLDYWLWDNNQQPFYQECAANFTEQTGININVVQLGWGEYWDGLTAGFATGDVPDVFTNHLAQYPSFVDSGVLVPLNDFVEADGVDVGIYADGLADLWVAPDGSRYGLPKDFDTISLVVNQEALTAAGLTMDDLANLDWNPEDGGTFESTIAALTVDTNGVRGNEDGFDASSVETYGYISNTGYADAYSQTGWSAFTATTGWDYLDTNPWGTVYNYDQPEFTDTMLWWASLIEKGYMPDSETLAGSGADTIFADAGAAMMTDGSWKIGTWTGADAAFEVDFAPTPIGPNGGRASMFNGLADSITTASENQDEAWEWVKYLGSAECQEIVGAGGVVFPAIPSATALAEQAFADKGADVSAFTIHVEEGTTFLFPISIEGAEVQNIVGTAIDAVMRGEGDAQTLIDANAEINELIAG